MARRLSRGGRFVAVVLAVTAVHGCVTRNLADRMEAFAASTAHGPVRLEALYVRALEPSAPPVYASAAPAPEPPRRRAARAPPRPPHAASAPEAASAPSPTALAEAPQPEAAPVMEAPPASEPAPATAEAASTPASAPIAMAEAAASAPAIRPASGPATGEAFEWPPSTRVTFVVTGNFRGDVSGNAQVEWIRVGTHYQVHLDFLVGPEFAPIIRRRMTSDGELTPDGLSPSRYDEETEVMFRERRRVSVLFEPDAVVLADGQRRERWRGVQDIASQFVQLTYLFTTRPDLLKVGSAIEMPVALPRNVYRLVYDVLEEVELQTPFGPIPAFHVKPRRETQKPGDYIIEMWFAPQLRYLPARIRIEQDPQTFLDMLIAQKPELAAR